MKVYKCFLLLLTISFYCNSYSQEKNLAEKLGYPKDARLLILHAEDIGKNAKAEEVEKEVRAQIEKATSFGIKLTHLDNHMGSILASPDMISVYQKIGKEYRLPVLVPMNMIRMMAPQMAKYVDTDN